jgi:hypothetical protein
MGLCGLTQLPDGPREVMLCNKEMLVTINHRLDKCHLKAESIIQSHRPALLEIARTLRENGYVERIELLQILT